MSEVTNSGNLNLNLDTTTDAFKAHPAAELAEMLRHIADQIEDGMTSGYRVHDSEGEGYTAWETNLPDEPVEGESDTPELDELDARYVDFIVNVYADRKDATKDRLVRLYRDNFDEDIKATGEDIAYITDLAKEDTKMGPGHYLLQGEFLVALATEGVLKNYDISTLNAKR